MRALLFETRTGNPIIDLEVTDWEYDTGILAADALKVTVPAYTARSRSLDLRALLVPRKHAIALIDDTVTGDSYCPAAGFIATAIAEEDQDGLHTYTVTCAGIERLFEKRHVRRYPGWPLTTPAGAPVTTYDMYLTGFEYGTIMKRLVQEALKWPGGNLPLTFEPDRAGTRARHYLALDGKPVLEALDDISEVLAGVEYDFQPRVDAADHVTWRLATGTDTARIITGAATPVINIGQGSDITGWERDPQAATAATAAVFTGGKQDDKVIAAYASSTALTDQGWPYIEDWDSSHSTVSQLSTLQAWADGRPRGITEEARFRAHARVLGRLRHGDHITLDAAGHWDMPDGRHQRRVLSIARNSSSPAWFDLKLVGEQTL